MTQQDYDKLWQLIKSDDTANHELALQLCIGLGKTKTQALQFLLSMPLKRSCLHIVTSDRPIEEAKVEAVEYEGAHECYITHYRLYGGYYKKMLGFYIRIEFSYEKHYYLSLPDDEECVRQRGAYTVRVQHDDHLPQHYTPSFICSIDDFNSAASRMQYDVSTCVGKYIESRGIDLLF